MEYLLLTKIYKLLMCIFIFIILKDINFSSLFKKKDKKGV